METTKESFERDKCKFLEDFQIGEVIHHWPGRTMSSYENQLFTLLTGNPSSGHLDVEDCHALGHADMVINGGYLLALVHGMSVREVSNAPSTVFFIGMTDVRILRPSYPGDTLRAKSKVLEVRVSKSKPDRGILTVETWGVNQRKERIMELKRSIMVYRRGCGPAVVRQAF